MLSDARGRPTLRPIWSFAAGFKDAIRLYEGTKQRQEVRTNVTPHRGMINNIVAPDDTVDEMNYTPHEAEEDEVAGRCERRRERSS